MSDEVKLPDPVTGIFATFGASSVEVSGYTTDQLRAYGEACRKDEREKCAMAARSACIPDFSISAKRFNDGLDSAVMAIRARSTP